MKSMSIVAERLVKRYGGLVAVDGVSLQVEPGEIFGLTGPDGAGKSSLFRMLTTLVRPDGGEARVAGFDVRTEFLQIRRRIGYMPDVFSLYEDLSVEENLRFFARVFGVRVRDNYHLIREVYEPLAPFARRRAGKLSGGMKQKLALSCALIHEPEVLFLDEPTTGVDAVSRKEFWDILGRIRQRGVAVLVATPYMDEAARCDRLALMQRGRLLTEGSPQDLLARYPHHLYAFRTRRAYRHLGLLRTLPGVLRAVLAGEAVHLSSREPLDLPALEKKLRDQGLEDFQLEPIAPTVEDCFIALAGDDAQTPQP